MKKEYNSSSSLQTNKSFPTEQLASNIVKDMTENPYLRYGQAVFNATYDVFPSIADELRGSEFDCFHRDELVGEFFKQCVRLFDESQGDYASL